MKYNLSKDQEFNITKHLRICISNNLEPLCDDKFGNDEATLQQKFRLIYAHLNRAAKCIYNVDELKKIKNFEKSLPGLHYKDKNTGNEIIIDWKIHRVSFEIFAMCYGLPEGTGSYIPYKITKEEKASMSEAIAKFAKEYVTDHLRNNYVVTKGSQNSNEDVSIKKITAAQSAAL